MYSLKNELYTYIIIIYFWSEVSGASLVVIIGTLFYCMLEDMSHN
jgi:hypothetical protein